MQTVDFVEFYCRPVKGVGSADVTIRLKQPIRLYDEAPRSPYRRALAVAARRARRELGLHPCAPVDCQPHDWSDGVDAVSAA